MVFDKPFARDYETLFAYFVGAKGSHAVHVRALSHAGFVVEADSENHRKSYVINPIDNKKIGVIVGEPEAVIGKFTEEPQTTQTPKIVEKKAGYKSKGTGW